MKLTKKQLDRRKKKRARNRPDRIRWKKILKEYCNGKTKALEEKTS